MSKEPDKVAYSIKDIFTCHEQNAISTLLVCDKILRAQKANIRAEIVRTIEEVKSNGGTVVTISSEHVSGQKLEQLGGIAAMLRFPVMLEDEVWEEEEEQLEEESKENDDQFAEIELADPAQFLA